MIDYAKTLYKPEFPHEINEQIAKYTNCKLPAFFEYAKDKEKLQVKKRNRSFVNKIYNRIPNKPINTRGLKLDSINYKYMMSNDKNICTKEVAELYDELNKQYRYMINMKDEYIDNLRYIACKIRGQFNQLGYTDEMITDMLVEYLYNKGKRYKQLLWFCYGQYIVNNLETNIEVKKTKFTPCEDCGEWIEVPIESKSTRCDKCNLIYQREKTRLRVQKYRNNKCNDM